MAITNTLTLTNNKVLVAETGGAGGPRTYTLKPDYNIFPHPTKSLKVILTDDADPAGLGEDTVEYDISTFVGNPDPTDVNATVVWLKDTYFKGLTIADLSVDTVNVDIVRSNLETIKNEANDMVKTALYYAGGVEAGNPSGSIDNIKTLTYSSVALGLTVTETFTWDATDKFLTSTLS
jgi:hypothetical protein